MARQLAVLSMIYGCVILHDATCQSSQTFCKAFKKQCPSVDANITLVTAVYDIGRANWNKWQRPLSEYLSYFKHVLSLNVPMVVFIEEELVPFVEQERTGKGCITQIYKKNYNDLEFFRYRHQIKHVLQSDIFRDNNDMLQHPEAISADYIIITNNKISFLEKTAKLNPFKTTHFYWLDAGYGHGNEEIFPKSRNWFPCNLLDTENQITYIELYPVDKYQELNRERALHKRAINPALNGGFFGGGQKAIAEYAHIYRKVFRSSLAISVVDDDQGTALQCYFELPGLFNFVYGDWYDVFRLFN